jgi:RHS repeat-associated protein
VAEKPLHRLDIRPLVDQPACQPVPEVVEAEPLPQLELDRYGNRWQQNVTAGSGPQPPYSFNSSNNQIVSYSYDAAGNMTNDGNHSYTYDAEGNITAVDGGGTATYVYNALNQRVRTAANGSTTEYVFNASGQRVTEWNAATHALNQGKYYWGGKPVAFYANSQTVFEHQDYLGTERVRTTYNGGVQSSYTSLPFGDGQTTSGADWDANHFAMLEHDTETDTDHAEFRQYSNTQGRFMSPDPYDGSYSTNPQSFNRYVYALNNPVSYVDPSGQAPCTWSTEDGLTCPEWEYDASYGGPPPSPSDFFNSLSGVINCDEDPKRAECVAAANDPANAPDNSTESKTACNAQRAADTIPGATLTGINGYQGGHEEFGIQVSGANLAGAGFSFYTTPFGNGNGYRTPFSGAHVNGPAGVNMSSQFAYYETFTGQVHFDVGNASSGFGGFVEHTVVDYFLGTLLGWIPGLHNFLDPGC